MNTKLVYVVTSNDRDIYLEQTLVSAYSARLYMPDAEIVLIVDDLTDATIKGKRSKILEYVTSKTVVKIEGKYTQQQRSRILKTSIREHIEGDFLFIDSDTIITSSLAEIDACNFDIAAVKDFHVSLEKAPEYLFYINKIGKKVGWPIGKESVQYNSGVIYVKDNDKTRHFYKTWNEYWHKGRLKGVNTDQPAFAMSNILNNRMMQELPGVWNCQLYYGLSYLYKSKIIHYWASNASFAKESLAAFTSDNFYLEIKKSGEISDAMNPIIANPLDYFGEHTNIIYGQDVDLWQTTTMSLLRSIYNNKLFKCIDVFSRLISKVKYMLK
jgi:hypothetical protein